MPNGVIPIYKEEDYTSFDVVAKLRGILGIKKIGHTGTLDPMATGVLPVCIGRATKLVDHLTADKKEYIAVIRFGMETDSYDITGKVIRELPFYADLNEILKVTESFRGEYEQIPPMFSAIRVNGRRLYDLARSGQEIERKARKCYIYDIEPLQGYKLPYFAIKVICSKGTYIRSLAYDLGKRLNNCACLAKLERTASGRFRLEDCFRLSEVEEMVKRAGGREKLSDPSIILPFLIRTDSVFKEAVKITVTELGSKWIKNGSRLNREMLLDKSLMSDNEFRGNVDFINFYTEDGRFLAMYRFQEKTKVWELVLFD